MLAIGLSERTGAINQVQPLSPRIDPAISLTKMVDGGVWWFHRWCVWWRALVGATKLAP